MPPQTNVASFVLRFIQETTDNSDDTSASEWRGVIKHVQSDTEQHFTRFADAVAFIARYVNLGEPLEIRDWEIKD